MPESILERCDGRPEIEIIADAVPGAKFTGKIYAIDPAIDINGRAIKVRATLDNQDGKSAAWPARPHRRQGRAAQRRHRCPKALSFRAATTPGLQDRQRQGRRNQGLAGRRENGFVEIIEGVSDGEQVVTAGQQRLHDGANVEIVPAAAGGDRELAALCRFPNSASGGRSSRPCSA